MNWLRHKPQYQSLIDQFLAESLSAQEFSDGFLGLLDEARTEHATLVKSWPVPYHEILYRDRIEHRISAAEYDEKRAHLFGYAADPPFLRLILDVQLHCHWCSPEAVPSSGPRTQEEREKELRDLVKASLRQYRQSRPPEADPPAA